MDGQVPEPVSTHKRLVDLGTVSGRNFEKVVGEGARKIATDVARQLGIDERRVKANLVAEEAGKYKPRIEGEEANREAVNITFESTKKDKKIIPAAESNASILKRLGDRALFIFNVYYVPHKPEVKSQIREKENSIKEAYQDLVSRHFEVETSGCGCRNGRHMCQIVREPNGLEEVKELSRDAKYICGRCGRVSSDERYLCVPVGI